MVVIKKTADLIQEGWKTVNHLLDLWKSLTFVIGTYVIVVKMWAIMEVLAK